MNGQQCEIGIMQWYRIGDRERVERTVDDMRALGVRHLRTGLSWADWEYEEGRRWIQWYVPYLADAGLKILACLMFTPPHLGFEKGVNSPPRDYRRFWEFTDESLQSLHDAIDSVELWNEHSLTTDWNRRYDPHGAIFTEMVRGASAVAHSYNKKTVLGGMNHLDFEWFGSLCERGILENIDVVGHHGLRGTWSEHSEGYLPPPWRMRLDLIDYFIRRYAPEGRKIWITETGYSTWDHKLPDREERQVLTMRETLQIPAERAYWYSLYDLPDHCRTLREATCNWRDPTQFGYGLKTADFKPKLLWELWSSGGLDAILDYSFEENAA